MSNNIKVSCRPQSQYTTVLDRSIVGIVSKETGAASVGN